jgi:thioredoxin-related protein
MCDPILNKFQLNTGMWMKLKSIGLIILALFFSLLIFIDGSASSSEIQWHAYDAGMARGKFEKKKIFLHFTADWCFYCGVMENEAFKDPAIISSLNENFVPIKVDYDKETETANFYRVQGLPDTIFIAEDGQIIGRRPGYIPLAQLKLILNVVLSQRSQE